MSFGQRVALIRKTKNLTQKDLGDLLGITGDAVSKYERDIITPSIELAAKIAKVLDISLDFLAAEEMDTEAKTSHMDAQLKYFNRLLPEDKNHVLAVIEAFIMKDKYRDLSK